MRLSVKDTLNGNILLTGGVGFLGSVCLQQLLALTDVKTVYLLVRSRKGRSAQERVQKLLCNPLFSALHQEVASGGPNVFSKVQVIQGDIEQPGMGLSAEDKGTLMTHVDVVIHSAASLTLDAHIQKALKVNYCGTQQLLTLASQMPRLRSFVYISTFYTNNFKPYNTPVSEVVHHPTLQLTGDPKELTYAELADLLLTLPADTAADEVSHIMARLNFTSTYAFSKLLTEQLVDDADTLPGVAKAIVRPSLIASMAGAPYPGFISGYAGAPGYCLAYGMGFFNDIDSVAFASDAIVDIIPVDTTAYLVVAAAAAASAHGPYHHGHARVYHAASAASNPEGAPSFFQKLHEFWTANPPPFKLPFARYPMFSGRHTPTTKSVAAGTRATKAKVWLAARLLQLSGNSRKARTLTVGFKAFFVQNDPRYARSIVSCVKNARKLQQSLVPEEQGVLRCVWEEASGADWESYTATALAGLRTEALKLPVSSIKGLAHSYEPKQGLSDPTLMAQWMAETPTSSSSSSTSVGGSAVDLSSVIPVEYGVPAAAAAAAVKALHRSSIDMHSICTSVLSKTDSALSSSSSSSSSSSDAGSDMRRESESHKGSSRQGWVALLPDGVSVKRTKSCHAIPISTL